MGSKKDKTNKQQNRNGLTETRSTLTVAGGEAGEGWRKGKGLRSTNVQLQSSHRGAKGGTADRVNSIIETTYGVRR